MTQPSFSIDPAQMQAVADNMGKLRDALTEMADRQLQPYAEGDDAVFGEYGAARAWTELLTRWTEELRCARVTAYSLSDDLQLSIERYRRSDADSAQRLGNG
ncbi:hypothetical protein ACNTMW_22865 [Planosporangium sp. 12N6]|uniref:hypothetical protein n=1 Tax=Planosporangium spinosum TaxID=3402278 RepID=UPI003CE8C098